MKKFILVCALMTGVAAAVVLPAFAQNSEEAGVRACIELYFRGHATGDGEHFRRAFHTDAKLFFIRDGKVTQWTLEEYAGRASGKPAPDEAQRKRRIESIDITGNAATAKIVLDYPNVTFTDYMSLLKISDEWKIVNKTFYANPKPTQPAGGKTEDSKEESSSNAKLSGALGTRTNPVRCDDPKGEREYLNRLRCPDGSRPQYSRIGSFGIGPYGNILDGYRVKCAAAAEATIFMDMYHEGYFEKEAVPGFTIVNQ